MQIEYLPVLRLHPKMNRNRPPKAIIFDLDGVLIDSEPIWRQAEREIFSPLGIALKKEQLVKTQGMRVNEVVQYWYEQNPWQGPSIEEVRLAIIERVSHLCQLRGKAKPGVRETLTSCIRGRVKLALASSSPTRVIRVVLTKLGIDAAFPVVCSAEHEHRGKPHPAVYLRAAKHLGVAPEECWGIEDSLFGVVAVKAAQMTCVAIPDKDRENDPRFSIADYRLGGLTELPSLLFE